MTASELVERLQVILKEKGDIEVLVWSSTGEDWQPVSDDPRVDEDGIHLSWLP